MRHRFGKHLAFPLHHRRVRRRRIRHHVPGIPCNSRLARHGDGILRRPCKSTFDRYGVQHLAALGQMELVRMGHGPRLPHPHDVLHHGVRLVPKLRCENGHRHLQRTRSRWRRERLRHDDGLAVRAHRLDALRRHPGLPRVQPGPAERRRAHHEVHDGVLAYPARRARRARRHAAWRRSRPGVLPDARLRCAVRGR